MNLKKVANHECTRILTNKPDCYRKIKNHQILKTAVEPPNTQMNADKTKHYMKKTKQPFGLNQYFPQAFDFSACIGVHRRLTVFFRLFGLPALFYIVSILFVFICVNSWQKPVSG